MSKLEANRKQIIQAGRQVYLAGLGIVSLVNDKTTGMFGNLVEKGKGVRGEDKPTMITKAAQKVQGEVDRLNKQVNERFQSGVSTVLGVMNVPSRQEINALSSSVERLTVQVEGMQAK